MGSKKIIFLTLFLIGFYTGCDQSQVLNVGPKDFYTTSNSYQSLSDFNTAVVGLYQKVRQLRYGSIGTTPVQYSGTDIFKNARPNNSTSRMGNYEVNLIPSGATTQHWWANSYRIVGAANTLIDQLQNSELSDIQKTTLQAQARFFRAWAYRELVYLYGGVPLVLHQITSPKQDFTRAPKQEVLEQMSKDFQFAAENLPDISAAGSERINDLAAYYYLGETYISLEKYDEAISALSTVIDNPNTHLMTQRFGTQKDRTPGDVYFDLFRRGNINRSSGNTEAIWVAQMKADTPGGLLSTTNKGAAGMQREHVPAVWYLTAPDGESVTSGPIGDLNCGGRGSSFMAPTDFFIHKLWENDSGDIRNKNNNFKRTLRITNPNSAYYDSSGVKYPGPTQNTYDWGWYPWLTKATTLTYPDALYLDKQQNILKSTAGGLFRNRYYIRLAGAYLLRAEAYLDNGNTAKAASDINVVRSRSNATLVAAGDIDIDYILNERARELSLEEDRRLTLLRLGKLVDRVRKYNKWNADDISDHNNLWPIPTGDIESNINADLQQNPGY